MFIHPTKFRFNHDVENIKPLVFDLLLFYLKEKQFVISDSLQNREITFKISHILYFSFPTSLVISKTKNSLEFDFNFQINNLLQALLIFILAAALFSTFSVSFYFWFVFITGLVFIISIYLMLHNTCNTIVNQVLIHNPLNDELTSEQREWIANPNVCPACGTEINDYSANCSECGLFIKHVSQFSKFNVTEDLQSYTINYTITNEKD
jgi:hypothetical protein